MGRVTITEAAAQLGVNKSTVSRWVTRNPALRDAAGLVSIEEVRAHRDAVINPALQTRGPAAVAGSDRATATQPPAGASLNDRRARTEEIKGLTAELDLAERLGLTVERAQVEAAIADAAEIMKAKASQLVRDRAEKIARLEDVRAVERALDEMMRDLFAAAARELVKAAQADAASDAA